MLSSTGDVIYCLPRPHSAYVFMSHFSSMCDVRKLNDQNCHGSVRCAQRCSATSRRSYRLALKLEISQCEAVDISSIR
eukprot:5221903-Pleurochrysis_carterae.AAC.2